MTWDSFWMTPKAMGEKKIRILQSITLIPKHCQSSLPENYYKTQKGVPCYDNRRVKTKIAEISILVQA
jgi:hypothetical protein